ncbi:MAG: sigma-70 family RNA polymerase sigma factor [Clostridia bacterium]|nr:sigma-70 family RNA polymerase sigma factor [Clostridia bacterium]
MDRFEKMEVSSLILLTRAGDNYAFAELVRRYTPVINSVVSGFNLLGTRAAEARSEAYVALYNAARSYDLTKAGVTFGLYAKICIQRRVNDFVGMQSREDGVLDDVDVSTLCSSCRIENDLVARENVHRIYSIARTILSDYEYQIFRYYLAGYTTRQTAEALGKSAKSVDNAKNRMMRHLKEHGSSFFD